MMKIKSLIYLDGMGNERSYEVIPEGKRCTSKEVNEVVNIEEHAARGEGDKWYYDITFKNGDVRRLFNVETILFEPPKNERIGGVMANCKTCGSEAVKISAFESPKCAKCGADFGSGNVEAAASGLTQKEIDGLINAYNEHTIWNEMFLEVNKILSERLATQKTEMASIDETEIRICEGCGRVEIKGDNGVRPPAIACCPDNTYHTIAQIKATQKSKMLALIQGPKTIDKAEWKYNAGFNEAIASVRKAFESEGIV